MRKGCFIPYKIQWKVKMEPVMGSNNKFYAQIYKKFSLLPFICVKKYQLIIWFRRLSLYGCPKYTRIASKIYI